VENREAILSVPGIDACLVGTGDLAMSMGHAGQVNHPEVQAAAEQVLAACRERSLIFTIPVRTPEEVARWQEKGVNMLSLSSDGGLLAAGARQFLSQVKK
jgi:2-dehydro-3-deoxyglucarate aldolase